MAEVPLFVYGTLMDPDILRLLIGRVPEMSDASMLGFRRYGLKGRAYPGTVREDGARVVGKLLVGLSDAEMEIMDEYEDEDYERIDEMAKVVSYSDASGPSSPSRAAAAPETGSRGPARAHWKPPPTRRRALGRRGSRGSTCGSSPSSARASGASRTSRPRTRRSTSPWWSDS